MSLLMFFGMRFVGTQFGWYAIWRLTSWEEWQINFPLGLTGPGYFFARGGVRLLLRWEKMRRQRMLWSITNAHLMVAFFFAFLFSLLLFIITPYSTTAIKIWGQTRDPIASLFTGLLVTFFPAMTLIIVGMAATLCVILPPSRYFPILFPADHRDWKR